MIANGVYVLPNIFVGKVALSDLYGKSTSSYNDCQRGRPCTDAKVLLECNSLLSKALFANEGQYG